MCLKIYLVKYMTGGGAYHYDYDYGSSHSLIPLGTMKILGLDISKPYTTLYSFDSKRVQCLGMIKYLVVRIVKIPGNFVMMDVVFVHVPLSYGMLLSRHRGTLVGGIFDLSFFMAPFLWLEGRPIICILNPK